MENTKKKVLIIVAIIIVLLIAFAGTTAAMIMTGNLAITNKQKLAKGLSDVGSKFSTSKLEEKLKENQKLREQPFEEEFTVTANVNKIELEDANGAEEGLNEIKKAIESSKITNVMKADLKNNIINENIKVNLGDIVEEISADVQYNKDRLSIRSKELNEKYITFTKDDVESNNQYSELSQVFEIFENACNKNTREIALTEEEKTHFEEYYKGIFSDYITDDMIKEEKANIKVDGKSTKCSNVNFTLTKNQIAELIGKYLNKLESDNEGKEIILRKFKLVNPSFEEANLQELIDEIKDELLYLDDSLTLKVSIYCSMFKTYGIDIELSVEEDKGKFSMILGNKTDELYLIYNNETVVEARRENNEVIGNIKIDGVSAVINIKAIDNKAIISVQIKEPEENIEFNFTATSEQIEKTEKLDTSKCLVEFAIKQGENNIDIAFNTETRLTCVDSIETTELSDENSINLVTSSQETLQQYVGNFTNNATTLVQNATNNSSLVKMILTGSLLGKEETPSEFNAIFRNYTGVKNGMAMKTLLQEVEHKNNTSKHKILASITENGNTIVNSTKDILLVSNSVNDNNEYTIFVTSLDDEGYITGIELRKVEAGV